MIEDQRRQIHKAITIYYNCNTGELADMKVSKRFRKENNLLQADVLHDIVVELGTIYRIEAENALDGVERDARRFNEGKLPDEAQRFVQTHEVVLNRRSAPKKTRKRRVTKKELADLPTPNGKATSPS